MSRFVIVVVFVCSRAFELARGEWVVVMSDRERKKEKKKKHKKSKLHEVVGYTNDDNPFGDSNLGATFTWKKKEEVEEKTSAKDKKRRA